ncbi:MAG: hypothetical protein AAF598_13315 [Bacteroidota bacterium]
MSFHQLEDIVEDAIRLIHRSNRPISEQRTLIYHLYLFHDREDTSYTRFRVKSILEAVGFLFELPIEQHPDYSTLPAYFAKLDPSTSQWIYGNVEAESGSLYLSEGKFYAEYGTAFWERIRSSLPVSDQTLPEAQDLLAVFRAIFELAIEQGDASFQARWYATFVNSILEFYVDSEDGLPASFLHWLDHEELSRIRRMAVQQQAILLSVEADDDELTTLPDLQVELDLATKPDQQAKIRFLMELGTTVDQIKTGYLKATQTSVDLSKFELIPDFFETHLGPKWSIGLRTIGPEKGLMTFFRAYPGAQNISALYLTLILDYDMEFKSLSCRIGIQLEDLLAWQNRVASYQPAHQHFAELTEAYLSEEAIESNKNLSNWGGWKYSARSSKKTLTKRLQDLLACLEIAIPQILEVYQQPLANWANLATSQDMMDQRALLLEKAISFFGNEMDFKMTMATVCQKLGQIEKSKTLIQEVQTLFDSGLGSQYLRARIQQGLDYLRKGEGTFPELSTIYAMRFYE